MRDEANRLESYKNWRVPNVSATPENLAKAGFYSIGFQDKVQCAFCLGILDNWAQELGDPDTRHVLQYPNCKYAKGRAITRTLEPGALGTKQELKVSENLLLSLMSSTLCRGALGVGLSEKRIKKALKLKIEQTGSGFSRTEDLIEAALNLHLGEASGNSETNMNGDAKEVLQKENEALKEAKLCKICLEAELQVTLLPCGHLATCQECSESLKICPMCRNLIASKVRTFLS